jgi:hypothetical protein
MFIRLIEDSDKSTDLSVSHIDIIGILRNQDWVITPEARAFVGLWQGGHFQ